MFWSFSAVVLLGLIAPVHAALEPMAGRELRPVLMPMVVRMAVAGDAVSATPLVAMAGAVVVSQTPVQLVAMAPAAVPASAPVVLTAMAPRGERVLAANTLTPMAARGVGGPVPTLVAMATLGEESVAMRLARGVGGGAGGGRSGIAGGAPAGSWEEALAQEPASGGTAEGTLGGLGEAVDVPAGMNEDDLLLLALQVNKADPAEVMETYQGANGAVWVPLGVLADALWFAIDTNPAAGTAQGWFLKPENTFVLDIRAGTVTVAGKTYAVDTSQVRLAKNEIYVTNATLERWFGFDLKADMDGQYLALKTTEPLPYEQQLARRARWESIAPAAGGIPSDTITLPYSLIGQPLVRLNASTVYSKNADRRSAWRNSGDVQLEGPLLYGTAVLSMGVEKQTGQGTQVRGGSFNYTREALDATMLGLMRARRLEVGDVNGLSVALADSVGGGRGARISNRKSGTSVDNPDGVILAGAAPIGWDVEVYQNESLLLYNKIDSTGRYRYETLPLRTGRNTFRLVFYGPNGEQQERTEDFFLGENMLAAGEAAYDLAMVQPGVGVLRDNGEVTSQGMQLSSKLEYGLTQNTTLSLGALGGTDDTAQRAVTAGLRQNLRNGFLSFDSLQDESGATAWAGSLRGRLPLEMDGRVAMQRWQNFAPGRRNLTGEEQVEILKQVGLGRGNLDTMLGYNRRTYAEQPLSYGVTNRVGLTYGRIYASNQLEYNWVPDQDVTNATGQLELAGRLAGAIVRGQLQYAPTQADALQSLNLSSQYNLQNGTVLGTDMTMGLGQNENQRVGASVQRSLQRVNVGLRGSVDDQGAMDVALNLGTALLPQPGSPVPWQLASPNASAGTSGAKVRMYTDTNANRTYDVGEPVHAGIRILNRKRNTTVATNEVGVAAFYDLLPNTVNALEIDPDSLPDIYLQPVSTTLNVMARPGNYGNVDVAMVQQGEICGTVMSQNALANVPLQLVNAQTGQVVAETLSEYDGYYCFTNVAMGTWDVQANRERLAPLGFAPMQKRTVALTYASPNVTDQTIMLTEQQAPSFENVIPAGGEQKK